MWLGWLKKRRSGGTAVSPEILLRGASRRWVTLGTGRFQVVRQLRAEELGRLVEIWLVGAGLGHFVAELVFGRT